MPSWADQLPALLSAASRQLFFIGGAPRSGTTWLQQIFDAHPDVSCKGEGHFMRWLAMPLDKLITDRARGLAGKNDTLFRHTGGYPLPGSPQAMLLTGTAILQALHQQSAGKPCTALGEKTPENVFFYPQLLALFPTAKFVTIMRDPRDVLTSSWHIFAKQMGHADTEAAKLAFISTSVPALLEGAKQALAFDTAHPTAHRLVTYEALRTDPAPIVADLFRLIGVADDETIVAACLSQTAFQRQTGGRPPGMEQNDAFHRKGVIGDWQNWLPAEANAELQRDFAECFTRFGWASAAPP